MSEMIIVGDVIVRMLEQYYVEVIYGVIFIYNLLIVDVVGQWEKICFVLVCGEVGLVIMVDVYGCFLGFGVVLISIGVGVGNVVGVLVEVMNVGMLLLYLIGQVEKVWLDVDIGFIYEICDQLIFLKVSLKCVYCISNVNQVVVILYKVIQEVQMLLCGLVLVEILIDIQSVKILFLLLIVLLKCVLVVELEVLLVDVLWVQFKQVKQLLLWFGGGVLESGEVVKMLVDVGVMVIFSIYGCGILVDSYCVSLCVFYNFFLVEVLIL